MDIDKTAKKVRFPRTLNLNEIPEQARLYVCDRASGEMNDALKDLIGSNPYSIEFEVQKVGNAYLAKGKIITQMPLVCSDCSGDYNEPVNIQFQEVLVINSPLQKGDQTTKANHSHEWDESQPQCTYLESSVLDLGDFLHEQIALVEPFRPTGKTDPEHVCEDLTSQVQREWLSIGNSEDSALNSEMNPFKVLEGLKLKS